MSNQMNTKKITRALATGTIVEFRLSIAEGRPGIAMMHLTSKDGRKLSSDFRIPEMGRTDPDESERAFDEILAKLRGVQDRKCAQ